MLEAFGHDLAVITRSHDDLGDAIVRNPYLEDGEGRFVHTVAKLADLTS